MTAESHPELTDRLVGLYRHWRNAGAGVRATGAHRRTAAATTRKAGRRTVLVFDRSAPSALAIRRFAPGTRLLARLRSHKLDEQLGRGASPDSSVLLSLRAAQLQSRGHRRMLADGYRRCLAAARWDARPLAVPLARAQIRECAALIEELAALLDAGQPVDAGAIVRAETLLSDSARSPLYFKARDGVLADTLQSVIAQLQAHPELAVR